MRYQRGFDADCALLRYAHFVALPGMRFSCTLSAANKFCGWWFLGQTAATFVLFARGNAGFC